MAPVKYSYCAAYLLLVVLSHLQSSAVESDAGYPPPPLDITPTSPVTYDYYGSGEICVVLSTSSTAIIEAPDPGTGQNFSINLPLDVPLSVRQSQGPCNLTQYRGGNCLSLVLFTSTDLLPPGRFLSFLESNSTAIKYGPLGLITPDGTTTVTLSETQRNLRLIYRTKVAVKVTFTVCSNGAVLSGFVFEMLFALENCRVGSIGGVSIPFEVNANYVGSLLSSVVGRQIVVTTASCSSPASGSFIVLDVRSPLDTTSTTIPVTPVDTPPPPTSSPPITRLPTTSMTTPTSTLPAASIVTTPTHPPSSSPPPGTTIALTVGIVVSIIAVIVLCAVGVGVAICVVKSRSMGMGNCHQKFIRNVSRTRGDEDAYDLTKISGDTHSPAQQDTPEPEMSTIQDMIQGTEEGEEHVANGAIVGTKVANHELNHTQIRIPPSDDENSNSVTQSPTETPTNTTGQSEPSANSTIATAESKATSDKSEVYPSSRLGGIVVDGCTNDDTPDSGDTDSLHKLDLSASTSEKGGVSRSNSGQDEHVLQNYNTESPDLTHVDVEASIKFPSELKKRAYSAPNKDEKNLDEKLNTIVHSPKKKVQDDHVEGGKSKYIENDEDTPEDVEKIASKVNQRPERVSGSMPVSRKEMQAYFKDAVDQGVKEVKDLIIKGNKGLEEEVKQQGATIREKQSEHSSMLGAISITTTATRGDVAQVKRTQEDMRDYQFEGDLESEQDHADEDYGEQSEEGSYKNRHAD